MYLGTSGIFRSIQRFPAESQCSWTEGLRVKLTQGCPLTINVRAYPGLLYYATLWLKIDGKIQGSYNIFRQTIQENALQIIIPA